MVRTRRKLPKFDGDSCAHFVTTRTHRAFPYFRDEGLCRILVGELKFYSEKLGFTLLGYVVMPDHVHLLLWWDSDELPELRVSDVMRRIKTMTSKRAKRYLFYDGGIKYVGSLGDVAQATLNTRPAQAAPKRFRLWQPGFYDFNVYTEEKLTEKVSYMHDNPVRAGLAVSPGDYRWSSCREYSQDGSPLTPAGVRG